MLGLKKADRKKRYGKKYLDESKRAAGRSNLPDTSGTAEIDGTDDLEVITLKLKNSSPIGQSSLDGQSSADISSRVEIGTSSVIGSRKSQQDSVFGYEADGWALGIVCDGMGGLNGGEIASRVALESLADAWFAQKDLTDIPAFFRREAVCADEKVYMQEAADGRRLQAGTTIVAAVVCEDGLYWLSVGDSRLYFIHGQEIFSLNEEHNYRRELNLMLQQGRLTAQEYEAEEYRAEALVSYLGIGDLSLMDISPSAYPLTEGDMILLASDGLYRSLCEEEILEIVRKNGKDVQQAADALTAAVKGRKKQDNTSVVILRYTHKR